MIVHVALPIPATKAFSYGVPTRWVPFIRLFVRVKVPVKDRVTIGFVTAVEEGESETLKEIQEVIDPFPLLDEGLVRLINWVSRYYIVSTGLVLRYALPPGLAWEQYVRIQTLTETNNEAKGLNGLTWKKAAHKVGRDFLYELNRKGLLQLYDTFTSRNWLPLHWKPRGVAEEKTWYRARIEDRIEYYGERISAVLGGGDNVLMLVPDHHGVGQFFYEGLSRRFPGKVLRYGSSVGRRARMEAYCRARQEGGHLVLGSRSCLFLPLFRFGLIIVERPEDDEYRNGEVFTFNAVDIALQRAEIESVPLVVGSLSPPLGIYKRMLDGEFVMIDEGLVRPPRCHQIITEKGLSSVGAIPEGLRALLNKAVSTNEVVVIFTPRKDYSSTIRCLDCKELFRCSSCGRRLSYERRRDLLTCGACGRTFPYQEHCPRCGSRLIEFQGMGVEYLREKLEEAFPDISLISITGPGTKLERDKLSKIRKGQPVFVIGTQTLARPYGLKADKLVLVEWEALMRIVGYRAMEKMFHLFSNLVDVLDPDEVHAVMTRKRSVNLDRFLEMDEFCRNELEKRRDAQFPPYGRIFLIEIERKSELAGGQVLARIQAMAREFGILGNITGPVVEGQRKYRWRMILKGDNRECHDFLFAAKELPGVRIEPDPVHV